MTDEDRVDALRKEWQRVRPDVDTAPVAVVARIGRAARFLDDEMDRFFQESGLTRVTWDILATLRRSGAPYRLSPTELYRAVMRSSGAMTRQLDNLEQKGWVVRTADPNDRRGVQVELTQAGLKLVDDLAERHVENERSLLAGLTTEEQDELAALLRKLLLQFEVAEP
jgi:DNA-binding MarR family transcriptional regulator